MADDQQLTHVVGIGNGQPRSTERSLERGPESLGPNHDERADDGERGAMSPGGGRANVEVTTEVATWTPEDGTGGGGLEERTVAVAAKTNDDVEVTPPAPDTSVDSKCSGSGSGPTGPATQCQEQQQQRRRRHRRGKSKRQRKVKRWKPYNERTWEEKRQLEEREARRALRREAERFAHGQPVAPYNTTQFLMEDHRSANDEMGGDAPQLHCSSSEEGEEGDANMDLLQRQDFCEVYDSLHAERLGSMSKHQLIQEYLYLEDRVEQLENSASTPQRQSGRLWSGLMSEPAVTPPGDEEGEMDVARVVALLPAANQQWNAENVAKVRIFQNEIRKLTVENGKLRRENELLKSRAPHSDDASPGSGSGHRASASDSDKDTGGGDGGDDDGHLVSEGEVRVAADA